MSTFLVTGSSRGLGLALVTEILALPTSEVKLVIATSRSESSALKKVIESSQGRAIFVKIEVTSEDSIKGAVTEVEKILGDGGIDVLINNAGIGKATQGGIAKMDDLEEHFTTNVLSAHLMMRNFLPILKKGNLKKIANISTSVGAISLASNWTYIPKPAYKITKAALNALTVQYSLDLAEDGFIVFAVSPGWLRTDMGSEFTEADLDVEVGAKAALEKILGAKKEDSGKLLNILVKGWENADGPNQYDGKVLPW